MKILVACEFSGIVGAAFTAAGHEVVTCDLLPTEGDRICHIQGDVLKLRKRRFDLVIAFVPCTYLTVSGNRWRRRKGRAALQAKAIAFFKALWGFNAPRIAIENPVGIMSTEFRKPDQVIQPWQFGHAENKKTCLWLKNLPLLRPTKIVRWKLKRLSVATANRVHHAAPGKDRWKDRSRTLPGIAAAMAQQWGAL